MPKPLPNLWESDPATLRLGLCQVYTRQWDVEGNFERALASLEEAARQGADLAVTPECVIHGYGFDTVEDYEAEMTRVAEPLEGPRLSLVRHKARELGIDVLFGFAEAGAEGRIHNSAAFISREGEILFCYRKVHCRDFEQAGCGGVFVPGSDFHVVERKYRGHQFRLGAMICFDREIPETVRCLRALGAELVLCPLACNTDRLTEPLHRADNEPVTRVRAAENELFIAVVNHAGRFNGGSYVLGPSGEEFLQLGPDAEVRMIELPVGAIKPFFHSQPWGWMGWGFRRPEVYRKYLPEGKGES